jgi:hypothetical protein
LLALNPDVNIRVIASKRRNVGNPWFKRGTLFRSAIDMLLRSGTSMTAREITDAVRDGFRQSTRKQAIDVQAAILALMRKHDGKGVELVGTVRPARWRLMR